MKVTMHYIEELAGSADWRWTHVPQGGLMPSRGPSPDGNGQITLNGNQYTANARFNRKTISPRPGWALGLIVFGVMGLFGASASAQYLLGAAIFALFGLVAIIAGILSYSKSFHIYALFHEGSKPQIPFLRDFDSLEVIKEIIDTDSRHSSEAAKAKKMSEFIHPELPWALIIMAAIAGVGAGALVGVIVASVR